MVRDWRSEVTTNLRIVFPKVNFCNQIFGAKAKFHIIVTIKVTAVNKSSSKSSSKFLRIVLYYRWKKCNTRYTCCKHGLPEHSSIGSWYQFSSQINALFQIYTLLIIFSCINTSIWSSNSNFALNYYVFSIVKQKTNHEWTALFEQALVHVSTAYANCDKKEIGETVYPPPADPHKLMECVDWMDEDLLNSITDK